MRAPHLALLCLACVAVGAALGWSAGAARELSAAAAPITARAAAAPKIAPGTALDTPTPVPLPGSEAAEEAGVARRVVELTGPGISLERNMQMLAWVQTLSAAECRQACEVAAKLKTAASSDLLQALATHWAGIDPEGAATYGLTLAEKVSGFLDSQFMQRVMLRWAERDLGEVEQLLARVAPGRNQDGLTAFFASALAESDPAAALGLLQRNPRGTGAETMATGILAALARTDPAAAAKAAVEYAWTPSRRDAAYGTVATVWAERDPLAALTWLATLPLGYEKRYIMGRIGGVWAARDAEGFFAFAQSLQDPGERGAMMLNGLRALAAKEPQAAHAHLQQMPAGPDREMALLGVAESVARKDPQTAAALLEQAAASRQRDSQMHDVCFQMAASDPKGALDWLSRHAALNRGDGRLKQLLETWMQRSRDEALAWASGLPEGENKDVALSTLITSLTQTDLRSAQEVFRQMPSSAQALAAYPITQALTQQGLDQALRWASALPDGMAKYNALASVAATWAREDMAAGGAWVKTLSPGPLRDRVIEGFTGTAAETNPEYALTWASTMQDPQHRGEVMHRVISTWIQTDPTKARAWIASASSLSESERRRWLRY